MLSTAPPRTTTSFGEAATVVAICFGHFIWVSLDSAAAEAGGSFTGAFTDARLLNLVAIECVFAAIALLFLGVRGYAVRTLLPRPDLKGAAVGLGLQLSSWVICGIAFSLLSPLAGPQPVDRMLDEASVSLPVIIVFAMVNGVYEEVFLLGFLMRGMRGAGLSLALGVMLLVRVLYHGYQGPLGMVSVLIVGLVFGLYYSRTGRLWPVVFAHMLWDIVPFMVAG